MGRQGGCRRRRWRTLRGETERLGFLGASCALLLKGGGFPATSAPSMSTSLAERPLWALRSRSNDVDSTIEPLRWQGRLGCGEKRGRPTGWAWQALSLQIKRKTENPKTFLGQT